MQETMKGRENQREQRGEKRGTFQGENHRQRQRETAKAMRHEGARKRASLRYSTLVHWSFPRCLPCLNANAPSCTHATHHPKQTHMDGKQRERGDPHHGIHFIRRHRRIEQPPHKEKDNKRKMHTTKHVKEFACPLSWW